MKSTYRKLWLSELSLSNFATFDNQKIDFSKNFNAIIGETGSGKSLILDALQFIFGQRADKKFVRKDAEFASIEAIFECNDDEIKAFFDEIGHPVEENIIVVKRLIYANESSKSYLNFQLCNLQTLQRFARRFIDLVGQFENQKLLSENYQLTLLDNYAGLNQSRQLFQAKFSQLRNLEDEITKLESDNKSKEQRIDYLEYQISELVELSPSYEDEQQLLSQKNIYQNKEQRSKITSAFDQVFNGFEGSIGVIDLLKNASQICQKNRSFFPSEISEELIELTDKAEAIASKIDSILRCDDNDIDINFVIDRLDKYQRLKKKFSCDTSELAQCLTDLRQELEQLKNSEIALDHLKIMAEKLHGECKIIALNLHQKREESAKLLSKDLTRVIRSLKMEGATIKLEVSLLNDLNINGLSSFRFLAETNKGHGLYSIKDIASGGELSRILLGLRQLLSSKDSISIFLFDEIDTGIGGETALCIGKALAEVASASQVLAITHLPQIAHFADQLLVVEKEIKKLKTSSQVRTVQGEGMKLEVQAMTPLN